ncbi:MAG: type I 3-dehydroquinate dehydratase [Methanothrix sp.]
MMGRSAVVAVLGEGAERLLPLAEEADIIELRLDLLSQSDPLETLKAVRKATAKPIIATARHKSEGGRFQGSEEQRSELLIRAAAYADYVDVELLAEIRDAVISRISKPAIVSYHDFKAMPDDTELARIFSRMKEAGAAIAKIAVTPQEKKDNLSILQFLLDADTPLCMIAMGDLGRHMRVVAPLYGSALTYAYVGESTAPGQMSLDDLCQVMRLLK